uniref:Intermediate capsid protein VP6 n=1 Tax=Pacific black duck rotavirus G TaxID=2798292 RepID=A0A7T4V7C8_9REOV|nr:VP6 [Pacific black duck rotavirus G]
MDLIETVNAIVHLQKRVLSLSANTNLNSEGQSIINDYNAVASRMNGRTYAFLDPTAILTNYIISMNPISLSTRISTDDFEEMKAGMNSLFDAVSGAIRTECSRPVRAVEQRVAEPNVRMFVDDVRMKSQYSELSIANTAAFDTAKLEPELVYTENPINVGIVEQMNIRANFTQHGGGMRFTTGRWSGNKGAITCISGTDGEHVASVEFKDLTTGVLNVIYIPAPGVMLQPAATIAIGAPVGLKCIDVSTEMTRDDFLIDFMIDNQVLTTYRGVGIIPFEMCNKIRFRVTPWDLARNVNQPPCLVNWQQNNANRQPTVSFLFEIRDACVKSETFQMQPIVSRVQYHMDTQFTADAFLRRPNVDWTVQSLLTSNNVDKVWCQKIAMCIAAFAAKV